MKDLTYITEMIEKELESGASTENMHGVNPRENLIEPRVETFIGFDGSTPVEMVVVLEEILGSRQGYWIVFDPEREEFGLTLQSKDPKAMGSFLGYHGNFVETLVGM